MDLPKLIELVWNGNQEEELKKSLTQMYISKHSENEAITAEEYENLCGYLTRWLLASEREHLAEAAKKGIGVLVKHPTHFTRVFNTQYMADILTNSEYRNRMNQVGLVTTVLMSYRRYPDTNQPRLQLLRHTRPALVRFLAQHGADLALAAGLADLYRMVPESLPETAADVSQLCRAVTTLLGGYSAPASSPALISCWRGRVTQLAGLLPSLWGRGREELPRASLHCVYELLASGEASRAGPAAGLVLDCLPIHTLHTYSQPALSPAQLTTALTGLLGWLTVWPYQQLGRHTIVILSRLAAHCPALVREAAEQTVGRLTRTLAVPLFRGQVEPVLLFLVYGHQTSPTLASSLAAALSGIPISAYTGGLAEAARLLLTVQPGLEPPARHQLQAAARVGQEIPPGRLAELRDQVWQDQGSTEPLGTEASLVHDLNYHRTRQVGLINLGNTCYMNCVLQAMYCTRQFRDLVLASAAPHLASQPILASLQQVFIFLRYSKRNIFSPSEFLRLARPSWFEPGRQQDCSEFLTHLLDQLQEEERAGQPRSEPAGNNGQSENHASVDVVMEIPQTNGDIVIEKPETSEDVVMEKSETNGNESCEDEAKDVVEEGFRLNSKKVKMGSGSSLGLSRWSTEENLSLGDSKEVLDISQSQEMLNVSKEEQINTGEETSNQDSHSTSSDSGIHSVESGPSEAAPGPEPGRTMVQTVFGGRMRTCYECQACNARSEFSAWFTDIHLPIPASPTPAPAPLAQQQTHLQQALAGLVPQQEVEDSGPMFGPHPEPSEPAQTAEPAPVYGPQPAPAPVSSPASNPKPVSQPVAEPRAGRPCVSQLLQHYFEPEGLTGDNQYWCEGCGGLQDAQQSLTVEAAPACLLLTLLRFKYDPGLGGRLKVTTALDYPARLELPVRGEQGGVGYSLQAVVIHSGEGGDSGHYYTWAREQDSERWLVLNDSSVVGGASWAGLAARATHRDTPYLLLYRREGGPSPGEEPRPHRALLDRVLRDNLSFSRERSAGTGRGAAGSVGRQDREDPGEGGGQSGPGCRDNFGQTGAGRFVC